MLCNITQNSQWNQKYYPFILCKYKKGKAIANFWTYECKIISDTNQIKYYNKSVAKFKEMIINMIKIMLRKTEFEQMKK